MRATLLVLILATLGFVQTQTPPSKSMPADVGPGKVAWFDITTTDLAKSKDFYGKLFDWKFNPVQGTDQAVEIVSGGASIGTIRSADGKISPFNGTIYVQVADIQTSCQKGKDLGGFLVPGFPANLPNGTGAIGILGDPSGHPIGLYSRTPITTTKSAPK